MSLFLLFLFPFYLFIYLSIFLVIYFSIFFAFSCLGFFLFGFVLTETFSLDEESSAGLVTYSQGDGLWAIPVPEKFETGDRELRTKISRDIKLKKEHVEIPVVN